MKYIKLFENSKSSHYMKDFFGDEIFDDMKILKDNYIPYNVYYTYFNDHIIFKIYGYSPITTIEKNILDHLNIHVIDGEYEFTFPWIEIKDEDELKELITAKKYNL